MFLTNNFIMENNFLINYLFSFFLFLIHFLRDYIVDYFSKVQINISIWDFRLVNHGLQSETCCQISELPNFSSECNLNVYCYDSVTLDVYSRYEERHAYLRGYLQFNANVSLV